MIYFHAATIAPTFNVSDVQSSSKKGKNGNNVLFFSAHVADTVIIALDGKKKLAPIGSKRPIERNNKKSWNRRLHDLPGTKPFLENKRYPHKNVLLLFIMRSQLYV